MTDLRLVAVTPERSHLVLEDDASNQFRVPIDERLATALRTPPPAPGSSGSTAPRSPGQLEIALESQLRPREMQTRIRAGHSIDAVAAAAGISPERVERYAAPVLAERAHVAEQARLAPARRATGGQAPRLGDLVDARLAEQRVAPATAEWDAWRGDDEARWTVEVRYHADNRERAAHWSFDPRGRVLAPADEEARFLVDEAAPERVDEPPARLRRLASVPAAAPQDGGERPDRDEVYDREADEARAAGMPASTEVQPEPAVEPGSATGTDTAAAEQHPARSARGRRPAVPSWDDILFGARSRD